jgi:hypothetical protein
MHGPFVFGAFAVHQMAPFEHQSASILRVDHSGSHQGTVLSKAVTGSEVRLGTLFFEGRETG